jgi:hypothetical protein
MPDPAVLASADTLLSDLVSTALSIGSDFFAFLVLTAILAAYGFYTGRDRLVALMLAVYPALLLYNVLPQEWITMLGGSPWVAIGAFAVLLIGANVAITGTVNAIGGSSLPDLIGLVIIAAATAGVILAISIHTLPVLQVFTFSTPTIALFTSQVGVFWWYLAPLVAAFFFAKS